MCDRTFDTLAAEAATSDAATAGELIRHILTADHVGQPGPRLDSCICVSGTSASWRVTPGCPYHAPRSEKTAT